MLSLVKGSLVTSAVLYVLGGVLGILLLFVGVNGLVRSLCAPQDGREEE